MLSNFIYRPAAGLLMNFSRGCDAVLGIMGPLTAPPSPSGNSYGSDGYHSDSEHCVDVGDSEMVKLYRTLYIKHRMETLDALDQLVQLKRTNHLKAKILFSIIVVCQLDFPKSIRFNGITYFFFSWLFGHAMHCGIEKLQKFVEFLVPLVDQRLK